MQAGKQTNTQSEWETVSSAWHFGLFRCVYFSFHNRLDLIREPAFYWVFYFSQFIFVCFIICKDEKFCCSSSVE